MWQVVFHRCIGPPPRHARASDMQLENSPSMSAVVNMSMSGGLPLRSWCDSFNICYHSPILYLLVQLLCIILNTGPSLFTSSCVACLFASLDFRCETELLTESWSRESFKLNTGTLCKAVLYQHLSCALVALGSDRNPSFSIITTGSLFLNFDSQEGSEFDVLIVQFGLPILIFQTQHGAACAFTASTFNRNQNTRLTSHRTMQVDIGDDCVVTTWELNSGTLHFIWRSSQFRSTWQLNCEWRFVEMPRRKNWKVRVFVIGALAQ